MKQIQKILAKFRSIKNFSRSGLEKQQTADYLLVKRNRYLTAQSTVGFKARSSSDYFFQ